MVIIESTHLIKNIPNNEKPKYKSILFLLISETEILNQLYGKVDKFCWFKKKEIKGPISARPSKSKIDKNKKANIIRPILFLSFPKINNILLK